jgi:transcriptional regulator with XRE-family HTH domain
MRAAKARGRQIGNRRRYFDKKRAAELRSRGWGQIKIARELGVGVGRVNKWICEEYNRGPIPETLIEAAYARPG